MMARVRPSAGTSEKKKKEKKNNSVHIRIRDTSGNISKKNAK
jgi:hypothetical protein